MDDESHGAGRRKRQIARGVAAALGAGFLFWAGPQVRDHAYLVAPIVGVAIGLVWIFDVPQWLFSGIDAARHKVSGVEHDGRHEWYGFRGRRVRLFLDANGSPWFLLRDIAPLLGIQRGDRALDHYGASEAATLAAADGERCLSEAGLRRLLAHVQHENAGAMLLWLEREVLMPLGRRGGP